MICTQIDADVAVLRTRRLDHQPFAYVWLDATHVHVRDNRHVVSRAIVIATGLRADGHREVLGVAVGDSENETFWRKFLTSPSDRGLAGVRVVISDAHAGLIKAIRRCFEASAGNAHRSTWLPSGVVPLDVSVVGRGPWQRDLRGPAADLSLPAMANCELASGSRASST